MTSRTPAPAPRRPRNGVRRRGLAAAVVAAAGVLLTGAVTEHPADPGTPSTHADGGAAAEPYAWPLPPPVTVARGFAPPPDPWSAGHRGVDLVAPAGTPVLAPRDGVVTFAGPVAGRSLVTVTHDDGLRSTFEPVTPRVGRGERVGAGAPVGTVARGSHCARCLHWGVRRPPYGPADYLDPASLVAGGGPIVLLPAST